MCGGELDGIQSLIENEEADEWTRGAALSSLVTLVAAEQKSREEIVSYFARLFRGKLVRQWSHVWDTLVCYSSDLYVRRDLARGKGPVLARLADNPHRRLVEDTAKEMGWWACFEEGGPSRTNGAVQIFTQSDLALAQEAASPQIKRPDPKIGRNEPCPCGSGKKHKKCCGA